jgi:hypothetical protein
MRAKKGCDKSFLWEGRKISAANPIRIEACRWIVYFKKIKNKRYNSSSLMLRDVFKNIVLFTNIFKK